MDVDLGSSNIVVFIELYVVKFYEVFILCLLQISSSFPNLIALPLTQ